MPPALELERSPATRPFRGVSSISPFPLPPLLGIHLYSAHGNGFGVEGGTGFVGRRTAARSHEGTRPRQHLASLECSRVLLDGVNRPACNPRARRPATGRRVCESSRRGGGEGAGDGEWLWGVRAIVRGTGGGAARAQVLLCSKRRGD